MQFCDGSREIIIYLKLSLTPNTMLQNQRRHMASMQYAPIPCNVGLMLTNLLLVLIVIT